MTDAEFLADYEARHGHAAMLIVARTLAMDPPRRKRPPTRVGAKPVKRLALSQNLVRPQSPSMSERHEAFREDGPPPETVRVVLARRGGTCGAAGCGKPFYAGDEVVRLYPSGRRVHGACAVEAAAERCKAFEEHKAREAGVTVLGSSAALIAAVAAAVTAVIAGVGLRFRYLADRLAAAEAAIAAERNARFAGDVAETTARMAADAVLADRIAAATSERVE